MTRKRGKSRMDMYEEKDSHLRMKTVYVNSRL